MVAALCTYGGPKDHRDLAALAGQFPSVAPGGLEVTDEATTVFPSCCCGLEGWRE
jgi:hypothetical protein